MREVLSLQFIHLLVPSCTSQSSTPAAACEMEQARGYSRHRGEGTPKVPTSFRKSGHQGGGAARAQPKSTSTAGRKGPVHHSDTPSQRYRRLSCVIVGKICLPAWATSALALAMALRFTQPPSNEFMWRSLPIAMASLSLLQRARSSCTGAQ